MGFPDTVPVFLADAEDRGPACGPRCAMDPEDVFRRHAEEPAVGRVLFLFSSDVFFREDGQLGEFFKAGQIGWIDRGILVKLLVEARILEGVMDLALQLGQDVLVPLGRRHGLQFR